jgi:hypothetical protein
MTDRERIDLLLDEVARLQGIVKDLQQGVLREYGYDGAMDDVA